MSQAAWTRTHRLTASLRALGVDDGAPALLAELSERYGAPQRRYHTLQHVDACLDWLDWFAASAERPAEVALALWFHDIVYEPGRSDNEAESAALARVRLRSVGVPDAAVARIAACIEATASHCADAPDASLTVDLDLAILGAAPDDYARFERAVRDEYAHVPDEVYRLGRTRVLGGFLARPRLYRHAAVHELLERPARENLVRASARLSAPRPDIVAP